MPVYNRHVIDYVHSPITSANMATFRTVQATRVLAAVLSTLLHQFQAVVLSALINHKTHIVVRCHHRHAQNETFHLDCHPKNNDLNLSRPHNNNNLKSKESLMFHVTSTIASMDLRGRVMKIKSQMVK